MDIFPTEQTTVI